jgi:hypothetical protein
MSETHINLYMDDVRSCPYVGFLTVRTVEDAMLHLSVPDHVNRCSLDHDMGSCADCQATQADIGDMRTPETTFMRWCPHVLDGTKLVRWMVETGHWPLQKPVVHSANPVGRARMQALIDQFFGQPAKGPMF